MTRITIRTRGIPQAISKLEDIVKRVQEPKNGLVRATNRVAAEWGKNFDAEGQQVGGWPELAEMTQNIREYQGFNADHPILIRYGALRAVAIEFFEQARREGQTSKGDNYSDEVVKGTLSIARNTASLKVGDSWKVANQWGFRTATGSTTPARPFWYVDRRAIAAAREGVKEWLEDDVLR